MPAIKHHDSAHKAVPYKTSEFIGIVHFLVASALQRCAPLPFSWHDDSSKLWGLLLMGIGMAWIRWVHVELHRYSQPHRPGIPTTQLIQTGPFRWSRNPTYAAILLGMVPGTALLMRNWWVLALWPAAVLSFEHLLIRGEEEYLSAVFSTEWYKYCQQTRRWI